MNLVNYLIFDHNNVKMSKVKSQKSKVKNQKSKCKIQNTKYNYYISVSHKCCGNKSCNILKNSPSISNF